MGWDGMAWIGLVLLRTGTSEHGNRPSGFISSWVVAQLAASDAGLSSMESNTVMYNTFINLKND
jgi:hypothetical protein